ncbi:MAG: type VI secretion system contractile sheath large subunit [Planctomycetales bacterium]|nr:type VI secretion system contractile sheath large subunit [Planctomycetales bacterium]
MYEPAPSSTFAAYREGAVGRESQATLLDQVIQEAVGDEQASPSSPGENVSKFSQKAALAYWLGDIRSQVQEVGYLAWQRDATRHLSACVAEIDHLVNSLLNEVLHAPRFQKLEASWRGLAMVVRAVNNRQQVIVRVLNASWRDVQRDFERASEFDNSQIFKKIYEEEFGMPGGRPFSVLIGDYEVHPRPTAEHPFDDVAILGHMAGVAAAAFCPFVCGASPSMFGVNDFLELQNTKDLAPGFLLPEFVKWRSLRQQEDARFVGIAMPKTLMRRPYESRDTLGFCFKEKLRGDNLGNYLWGNAAYAWGTVLIRSFEQTGWLADIRGTERNQSSGGLVSSLPSISFGTDRSGVALRSCTDLIVTDQQEAELAKLGFLALCQCYDTDFAAFYSTQSIQKPARYDSAVATANANISSMLQYMLCASRFSHYLKVIARDIVGAATEAEELETFLNNWIKRYVTPDERARPETKARLPLRQAQVNVVKDPSKPGSYQCTFSLLPHYQLDDLSTSIRLQTSLDRARQ